ncbi:MAG: hypothetical protein WCP85_09800 [Mariniphaga sp.]
MNLQIVIDNKLEEFTGKLSKMTYEKLPVGRKPILISNNCFQLFSKEWVSALILIDESIIEDGPILYLHQSVKDLIYPNNEFITL